MISFIGWYILVLLVGLITHPVARRLFGTFHDEGYGLSKILGILLFAYLHWILVTVGVLPNTFGGAVTSLTVLTVVSWSLSVYWGGEKDFSKWMATEFAIFNNKRSVVLSSEIVFLVAFLFWAFIRALNPEVSGTEKPMELAFINSIMASNTFPPADPWLSGYAISYYHFGYIMAALIAIITGTSGSVAFNLMLALTVALASTAAYSLIFNLLSRGKAGTIKDGFSLDFLAAYLGPIFLTFVSNAEGFLELLHSKGVGWQNGVSSFWQWLNIKDLNMPPAVINEWPPRFWFWWRASRVLQDYDFIGNFYEIIDEFPVFSFLLGDLHPHVLSIPYALLIVGMGLSALWSDDPDDTKLSSPVNWLTIIALGGMAFLNTWDFPIYFALVALVRLSGIGKRSGWTRDAFIGFLGWAIPVGLLSILAYLPFYLGFSSQAGGLLPNIIFPTRGAYLWIMFLPLLVPILLYLPWSLRKGKGRLMDGVMLALLLITLLAVFSTLFGWLASTTPDGAAILSAQGFATYADLLPQAFVRRLEYSGGLVTLALVLALGLGVVVGYARQFKDRSAFFIALLVVLGALLVIAPEFVFLRDQFGNRMNTVFKFYYQAWILWSIAAAYGTIKLVQGSKSVVRFLVVFILAVSTGIGMVYTVTALPDKADMANIASRTNITLDGAAQFKINNQDEWQAFGWLANQPRAVIVEAVGGSYTDFARMSTFSGQPTLLGWPGHESQWRGGFTEIGSRQQDVEAIYTSPDWESTRQLLVRYAVDFVVVGNMERNTYAVNEQKLIENMPIAFQSGNLTIYAFTKVP